MSLEASEINEASRDIVPPKLRKLSGVALRLVGAIEHWLEKRRSRRTLAELNDDQLRDVGLTRAEAKAEVSRSWFWIE
ncbi:hypothetical protein CO670_06900 [Rhizobium sp. J15]|uniref:DUF1127 domain-containing protein n=1 Tax=Rhizobium sp. J15 TaxID=2035450 RepID=UPI000BE8D9B2|nr:DUF1127 domain-containing protein [Rhizobium sp. J15]PDT17463.1 hypothetical protein CO670_06900 [Rhizobium sp. J15]